MKQSTVFRNKKTFFLAMGIFILYIVMSSSAINEKQVSWGNMHNLYNSNRLSEGVPLNELDLLYGPVFYGFGSFFMKLGLDYIALKIVMLGISVLTGVLVFLIAQNVFKDFRISVLSTAFYMFLPIHYGMGPSFDSDSFAIIFILFSVYLLTVNKKYTIILAGMFAAIAVFTKIPVLPLAIAPLGYFLIYQKKEIILYSVPFFLLISYGIFYLNSIMYNSDNTRMIFDFLIVNPDNPIPLLRDFGWIEGFVVIVAIVGLFWYVKKFKTKSPMIFVALASPIAFGAILLPGVGIYEAEYVEPFVAIFAALTIFFLYDTLKFKKSRFRKIIPALLIIIIFTQFIIFVLPDRERILDWDGDRWAKELNTIADIHTILLEEYSSPGDYVIASPMALYRTDRVFPLDHSQFDVLKIKYDLGYETALEEMNVLHQMIDNKKIKMLIAYNSTTLNNHKYDDMQNQLFFPFYLDSLKESLAKNYEEFEEKGVYFYLPKE